MRRFLKLKNEVNSVGIKKLFVSVLAMLSVCAATSALAQSPDKILGRWADGWYVGTVIGRVGKEIKFLFDDGDEALVAASGVRYYWGVITTKSGGRITVRYDDAMEETTGIGRCRQPL